MRSSLTSPRSVLLLALVCLVAALSLVRADTYVLSSDGSLGVQFTSSGTAGGVSVFANTTKGGDVKVKRSFEFRWDKITEINAAGDKVQDASGFAVDAALWQGPTSVPIDGISAQRVRLNNTLDDVGPGATVALTAYIFSQDAAVSNGPEQLLVPANSLKLTIGIRGWPFQSTTNRLTFGVELKLDSDSSSASVKKSEIDNNKQQRLDWGGAALDLANSAVVDGVLVPITTTLEQNSAKTMITFTFPHFNRDVVYDPTVSFNSAAGVVPSFALLATLLSAVFAGVRQTPL